MPPSEHDVMVQLAVSCLASCLDKATYGERADAMLEELRKLGCEIVTKRPVKETE